MLGMTLLCFTIFYVSLCGSNENENETAVRNAVIAFNSYAPQSSSPVRDQ
jgi:hypothetical protein